MTERINPDLSGCQPDMETDQGSGLNPETWQLLNSPEFRRMLATSNMPIEMFRRSLALIDSLPLLEARASYLSRQVREKLKDFYGKGGDILIPFSGGYDSSGIAAATLKMYAAGQLDCQRELRLVTAVTGMAKRDQDKPAAQVKMLSEHFNQPINHFYLDLSACFEKLVIDPARQDREALGCPALCPACKAVMEAGIAELADRLGVVHIPWGYNRFQAALQWPEQHQAQRKAMAEFLEDRYPGLNIGSPFFELVNLPVDPILIFDQLGLPPKNNQGGEARCWAAGTNPAKIDPVRLSRFVTDKLRALPETLIDPAGLSDCLYNQRPLVGSFGDQVEALRGDETYMAGHFDERGSGHLSLRYRLFS